MMVGTSQPPAPRDLVSSTTPETQNGILKPALTVGAVAGVSGLLAGAIGGVLRSSTPVLFAFASGIQWFTLGSSFWGTRSFILREQRTADGQPRDMLASTVAGGVSGSIGGLLRGRKNVVPGMVMFAVFGAAGQGIWNYSATRRNMEEEKLRAEGGEKGLQNSWLNSKWSPVKVLTDEEYGRLMDERLLRVRADLAILDENLERLRKEAEAQMKQDSK